MISFEIFKRFFLSSRSGALIKRLSFISLAQIVLSLFAFVVVLSVMSGMNLSIEKRVNSLEPDLILEIPEVKSIDQFKIQPIISRLTDDHYEVDYVENSDVILRTADGFYRGLLARGLSEKALQAMAHNLNVLDHKTKPNPLDLTSEWGLDEMPGEGEIILGYDTAQILNVFEGDWLTIIPPEALLLAQGEIPTLERVQVKKIISTRLSQLDSQLIWYVAGKSLTRLKNSPSRRLQASVKLKNPSDADQVKKTLSQFKDAKVVTWKERNQAFFAALALEKFCIGFILMLAGVISSFSVVMALSLLINQKQKDWALLRALGFTLQGLQTLILKMGLWLSFIGVLSGVALGTLFSLMIQFFPPSVLPSIYYDSEIPAEVEPGFILLVAIIAMVICYWACAKTARSLKSVRLN